MSKWVAVTVAETRGSAPREPGATMRVWPDLIEGTIGGGTLEWEAIQQARSMLVNGDAQTRRTVSLGPELGQCCGGAVVLDFIANALAPEPTSPPIWIWGAGHVGRAIAAVLAPFEDREVVLIDVAQDRFPAPLPARVKPAVATDPVRLVPHADPLAHHLIVTYSHDLDLKLCCALLHHGFGFAGLIGSATKWARFRKRLVALGHTDVEISRICCPIGQPTLGKHPQAIAVGVASTLLMSLQTGALTGALGKDIAL